jgi:haloalkane dehalogenase
MQVRRTPDDRFAVLEAFDWAPRCAIVAAPDAGAPDELRMCYVDEGPSDAAPVVLVHGEPTWSFLYRHMIPVLVEAGLRVVVPDLIGFGRSDKPARIADHSYARHVAWTWALVEALALDRMTWLGQDWGGLIGLRLVAEMPDLFARVMIGNTALPTGDHSLGEAFEQWRAYSQSTPEFNIGGIVSRGTARGMAGEAIAAYDAPFPDESYKAGARAFPMLVPSSPDDPAAPAQRAAWESLRKFDKPFLTCFSDKDIIMRGGEAIFRKLVPGAAGQDHFVTRNASHFLQEDAGPELAKKLIAFARKNG